MFQPLTLKDLFLLEMYSAFHILGNQQPHIVTSPVQLEVGYERMPKGYWSLGTPNNVKTSVCKICGS